MCDNSHGVFTHCHPCAGTVLPQTCATAYAPMLPPSACLSLYLLPLDRGLEMMTTHHVQVRRGSKQILELHSSEKCRAFSSRLQHGFFGRFSTKDRSQRRLREGTDVFRSFILSSQKCTQVEKRKIDISTDSFVIGPAVINTHAPPKFRGGSRGRAPGEQRSGSNTST